jgi:hypothetical protein
MKKFILLSLLLAAQSLMAQSWSGQSSGDARIVSPYRLCAGSDNGTDVCFGQTNTPNVAQITNGTLNLRLSKKTVSTLPAANAANTGQVYWISDGTTSSDCTTGNGANFVLCISNGTAWQGTGGGGGGGGGGLGGVNLQTIGYTPQASDCGKQVSMSGANLTLTLPNPPVNSTCSIFVSNLDATPLTISRNTLTIDGVAGNVTLAQNQGVQITTDGVNYFTERGIGTSGGSIVGSPTNATQVIGNGSQFVPQAQATYDVRNFGVDCTGVSDSTTALQNLINSAPDYSSFHFPQACKVKVSGATAITIDQRIGLQFIMDGRNGNNCLSSTGEAQLFYSQAYGAGNRVLYINRSQALEFRNLMVNVNGGGDVGIDIDQVGATPPITTRIDFYSPCIANQVARNANFVGIRVSNQSLSNVENIHFYHPDVLCSTQGVTGLLTNGNGIEFGNSNNQKNNIVDDMRNTNCSIAVKTNTGSDYTSQFGLGSSSWTDFSMGGFNDAVMGYRSEFAQNPIIITNAIGPHLIMHNDFAAVAATPVINCVGGSGCGQVTLINNNADNTAHAWFNGTTAGGTLFSVNNRNSVLDPLSWGYSWNFQPGSGATDTSWISSSTRITPGNQNLNSQNLPSPPLIFETVDGGSHVYNQFLMESFAEGALSNAPSSHNFSIFHSGSGAHYITLGSPLVDLKVTPNVTSAPIISSVAFRGVSGATNWCYAVVAVTVNGHSAASAPLCVANGNATLTTSNFNLILLNSYSGAISYDIYRTTASGTPNTTGKIGSVGPRFVNGGGTTQSGISFNDTGTAGDATTAPTDNSTGQVLISTPALSTTNPLLVQVQTFDIIKAAAVGTNSQQLIFGACYTGTTPAAPGADGARQIACSSSANVVIGRFQSGVSSGFINSVVQAQAQSAAGTGWKLFSGRAGVNADGTIGSGQEVYSVNGQGDIAGASLALSGLTPGTSPVCPNGAGGTLTTTGCAAGGGSGTVTVVGAGSLTSTAIVTGGGTTTVQTPSASATVDGSGNITAPSVITSTANGGFSGTEGTGANVPATASKDVMWPDSTAHRWLMNNNNEATNERLAGTFPSGTVTTAGTIVNAGTCQAQTGITVTGALTTDNVVANIGAVLPATWQTGIVLSAHVTASNTVTVYLCNGTAGNITPAATAVNVRILR